MNQLKPEWQLVRDLARKEVQNKRWETKVKLSKKGHYNRQKAKKIDYNE